MVKNSTDVSSPQVVSKDLKNLLHALEEIDDFSGITKILGNYCITLLAIALTSVSFWFYPISVVLIGSRLRALENLTHEASHRQLFRNCIANDWIASILCAFPTQSSLWQYRKAHKKHHLYLGNPERDPDLPKYGYLPLPANQRISHLVAVFTSTYDLKANLLGFAQSFSQPFSKIELFVRLVYWLICLILISLSQCWLGFLLFYIIPFLTTYRVIRQLVDMSEHILDVTVENHTRNVFCSPILRFLLYPHGDFLHLTHHMYPAIPGASLLKAHQLLLTDPEYIKVEPFKSYFLGKDSVLAAAFKP